MTWVVSTRLEFESEQDARAAAASLDGEVSVQEHVPYTPPTDAVTDEEEDV